MFCAYCIVMHELKQAMNHSLLSESCGLPSHLGQCQLVVGGLVWQDIYLALTAMLCSCFKPLQA